MELKQKILVVDAEPSLRRFFKTLLEVDGYHVDMASSGKEAIARVNKGERPDFVILGVRMAEMGGLEWLHELLRLDRSLSVIMTSCSNEPGTIAEALRLGARDYLAPLSRKRNSMRRCSGRSTLMDLLNNLPRTN